MNASTIAVAPKTHATMAGGCGAQPAPDKPAQTSGGGPAPGATFERLLAELSATVDELSAALRSTSAGGAAAGSSTACGGGPSGEPTMGVALPTTTVALAGDARATAFQRVDSSKLIVPLAPVTDAQSALDNFGRIVVARQERAAQLQTAIAQDRATNGSMNPIDMQRTSLAQSNAEMLAGVVSRIRPLVGSMTAADTQELGQIAADANTTGSINPTRLYTVATRIEGRAAGLPEEYLAALPPVAVLLGRQLETTGGLSQKVARDANRSGSFDPVALQELSLSMSMSRAFQERFRGVLDLARTDPAAATARLTAAANAANGGSQAVLAQL